MCVRVCVCVCVCGDFISRHTEPARQAVVPNPLLRLLEEKFEFADALHVNLARATGLEAGGRRGKLLLVDGNLLRRVLS
jgi:hypothetical protein